MPSGGPSQAATPSTVSSRFSHSKCAHISHRVPMSTGPSSRHVSSLFFVTLPRSIGPSPVDEALGSRIAVRREEVPEAVHEELLVLGGERLPPAADLSLEEGERIA